MLVLFKAVPPQSPVLKGSRMETRAKRKPTTVHTTEHTTALTVPSRIVGLHFGNRSQRKTTMSISEAERWIYISVSLANDFIKERRVPIPGCPSAYPGEANQNLQASSKVWEVGKQRPNYTIALVVRMNKRLVPVKFSSL